MNVYKFNPITKEYTGVEPAMLDPLESKLQGKEVYLLPANATLQSLLLKMAMLMYGMVKHGNRQKITEKSSIGLLMIFMVLLQEK